MILFYSRSDKWTWNPIYLPYDEEYVGTEYRHEANLAAWKLIVETEEA